jgi:hypothetical protein
LAIALLTHTVAEGNGSGGTTTSGINTTGASLIVVAVTYPTADSPGLSDSKSNTWTGLTAISEPNDASTIRLFYAANPVCGTGHTFSTTSVATPIAVIAFSGTKATSPFDQQSGAHGSSGGLAPGAITPSQNNCLLVTAEQNSSASGSASGTINGGFTITDQSPFVSGVSYAVGMAYLIQTTAASANPSWDYPTYYTSAVMASFLPTAASPLSAALLCTL